MLHYDNMSIEIPEWTGREVAELWRMQKNAHVAVCSFWTNPEGAELRLTVDGQVQRTEVSHHLFALPIVALAWKERYHWIKGWRSPATLQEFRQQGGETSMACFSLAGLSAFGSCSFGIGVELKLFYL
jgi:hypothetical protein